MNLPAARPSQTLAAYLPNPFNTEGLRSYVVTPGETVREFLDRSELIEELKIQPILTILNGRPLLEAGWDTPMDKGDLLHLQVLPEVFLANPAFWEAVYTVIQVAAVAVAIYGLVTLPDTPEAQTNQSPNQNLQIRSNRARLGEAIPVLYGKMRIYPDLSAQPHREFLQPNDLMYTMLYELSQGSVDVDEATMSFEDTPLSSFRTVSYEIIPPGSKSLLYPREVAVSSEVSDLQVEQGTTAAYVANPPATEISRLTLDVSFPRGIYRQRSSGKRERLHVVFWVEYQKIDDAGVPEGPYVARKMVQSGDSVAAVRRSISFGVPVGRYQVRLNRTSSFDEESKLVNFMNWSQLKGFYVDDLPETTTTRVAVRIRASEELGTRALTRFNLVGARRLSTYDVNSGSWGPEILTKSCTDGFMDALHNTTYGGTRGDAHINLQELTTLGAQLDAEGFELNGIMDSTITLWDFLTRVGNTCHCVPVDEGGVYTMLRDEPKTVPVQMFNMRNIVQGSFSMEHIAPLSESKDHVVVEFFDRAQNYRPTTITCALPDANTDDPQEIKLWGVDNAAQATQIGLRIAAIDRYRREPVTLITPLEGQIPRWGELVRVSHVVLDQMGKPQISGDVLERAGNLLTLSEPGLEGLFVNPHIVLPSVRNEPLGPYPVLVVGDDQVLIQGSFDASGLLFDQNHDFPRFQMGHGTDFDENVRVLGLKPRGGETVQFEGFIDAPEVFDPLNAPPPKTLADAIAFSPRVYQLQAELSSEDGVVEVLLSWRGDYSDRYDVEYSIDDGGTWIDMGADRPQQFLIDHPSHTPGPIKYRVAGVSILQGLFTEVEIDTSGPVSGPSAPAAPNKLDTDAIAEGVVLTVCVPATGADPEVVEIWRATSPDTLVGDAVLIDTVPTQFNTVSEIFAAYKVDGSVVGDTTYHFFARARTSTGVSDFFPASGAGVPVTPPPPGNGAQGIPGNDAVYWGNLGVWSWHKLKDGRWVSPDGINEFVKVREGLAFRGGTLLPIGRHSIQATLDPGTGNISIVDVQPEIGENTNVTGTDGFGTTTVEVELTHINNGTPMVMGFTSNQDGANALDVFPAGIGRLAGRLSILPKINWLYPQDVFDPGELGLAAGKFILPDGTVRTLSSNTSLFTPLEGAYYPPGGRMFWVSGAGPVAPRFQTLALSGTAASAGHYLMVHDGFDFYAVDNAGTLEQYVPDPASDYILATIEKAPGATEITGISVHVPNVKDGDSPAVYLLVAPLGKDLINGVNVVDGNNYLTLEIYRYVGATIEEVTAGSVQIFDSDNTPLGHNPQLNRAQIDGAEVFTVKSGASGPPLDTATLNDTGDAPGMTINSTQGLVFLRDTNGDWQEEEDHTDIVFTARARGGDILGQAVMRVTRTDTGLLSSQITTPNSDITIDTDAEDTRHLRFRGEHSNGTFVEDSVTTSFDGLVGAPGGPGSAGPKGDSFVSYSSGPTVVTVSKHYAGDDTEGAPQYDYAVLGNGNAGNSILRIFTVLNNGNFDSSLGMAAEFRVASEDFGAVFGTDPAITGVVLSGQNSPNLRAQMIHTASGESEIYELNFIDFSGIDVKT